MKIELENVRPMEIETRSFEMITEELGDTQLVPGTEGIVKRCIHTSADFDYAQNLCFSEHAAEKAMEAIKKGACIVTDTQMAKAGINKKALARFQPQSHVHFRFCEADAKLHTLVSGLVNNCMLFHLKVIQHNFLTVPQHHHIMHITGIKIQDHIKIAVLVDFFAIDLQ